MGAGGTDGACIPQANFSLSILKFVNRSSGLSSDEARQFFRFLYKHQNKDLRKSSADRGDGWIDRSARFSSLLHRCGTCWPCTTRLLFSAHNKKLMAGHGPLLGLGPWHWPRLPYVRAGTAGERGRARSRLGPGLGRPGLGRGLRGD